MKTKNNHGFPPVDKQAWIDQAVKDLKGEDFGRLITKVPEGFSLLPFYTAEDAASSQWVKYYENRINPPLPDRPPRIWSNTVEITVAPESEMNREILSVLNNGADGIILGLTGKENLNIIFNTLSTGAAQVWLRPLGEPAAILRSFLGWFRNQSHDFSLLHGGILWDSLTEGFKRRIDLEQQLAQALALFELSLQFPHFKSICLDTAIYHNTGATNVQELGYGMAAFVELMHGLTENGAKPEDIFRDTFVYTAVGSNFFMELAKLKTYRAGFQQLGELYGVAVKPEDIHLFVASSQWTKSGIEADNNLIRNTAEAMAAVIGGCNTLFVAPHDNSEEPDNFSKRMARNISLILKDECYFDKVMDPFAGSYFVECLMDALHGHAFGLLKTVEEKGGWWKSYLNHTIQDDVKKTRLEKFNRVMDERLTIPGISSALKIKPAPEAYEEEAYQLKPIAHSFNLEKSL